MGVWKGAHGNRRHARSEAAELAAKVWDKVVDRYGVQLLEKPLNRVHAATPPTCPRLSRPLLNRPDESGTRDRVSRFPFDRPRENVSLGLFRWLCGLQDRSLGT